MVSDSTDDILPLLEKYSLDKTPDKLIFTIMYENSHLTTDIDHPTFSPLLAPMALHENTKFEKVLNENTRKETLVVEVPEEFEAKVNIAIASALDLYDAAEARLIVTWNTNARIAGVKSEIITPSDEETVSIETKGVEVAPIVPSLDTYKPSLIRSLFETIGQILFVIIEGTIDAWTLKFLSERDKRKNPTHTHSISKSNPKQSENPPIIAQEKSSEQSFLIDDSDSMYTFKVARASPKKEHLSISPSKNSPNLDKTHSSYLKSDYSILSSGGFAFPSLPPPPVFSFSNLLSKPSSHQKESRVPSSKKNIRSPIVPSTQPSKPTPPQRASASVVTSGLKLFKMPPAPISSHSHVSTSKASLRALEAIESIKEEKRKRELQIIKEREALLLKEKELREQQRLLAQSVHDQSPSAPPQYSHSINSNINNYDTKHYGIVDSSIHPSHREGERIGSSDSPTNQSIFQPFTATRPAHPLPSPPLPISKPNPHIIMTRPSIAGGSPSSLRHDGYANDLDHSLADKGGSSFESSPIPIHPPSKYFSQSSRSIHSTYSSVRTLSPSASLSASDLSVPTAYESSPHLHRKAGSQSTSSPRQSSTVVSSNNNSSNSNGNNNSSRTGYIPSILTQSKAKQHHGPFPLPKKKVCGISLSSKQFQRYSSKVLSEGYSPYKRAHDVHEACDREKMLGEIIIEIGKSPEQKEKEM
ncbi:hypothetical protein ADUPG1_008357, partial [Aduncisulcus paluster]